MLNQRQKSKARSGMHSTKLNQIIRLHTALYLSFKQMCQEKYKKLGILIKYENVFQMRRASF